MNQQFQQTAQAMDYASQSWTRFYNEYPVAPEGLSNAQRGHLRNIAITMKRIVNEAEALIALDEQDVELNHG